MVENTRRLNIERAGPVFDSPEKMAALMKRKIEYKGMIGKESDISLER